MSIVNFAPAFTLEQAGHLAKEFYGLDGEVEGLPSERDQNFLIRCGSGERFVLKIANATEQFAMLEAQNRVMAHVARFESLLPNIVSSLRREEIETVFAQDGSSHFMRLVTYLPGRPMGTVKRHTPGLLFDLGQKLGRLDQVLQEFDHPALHRDFYWDFSNGLNIIRKNLELVKDTELSRMVDELTVKFENVNGSLITGLKKERYL